jgi:RNA polymerase sigma factor (sigma-70 family)
MANEPDHLLLRRYVVARERGRTAETAQIWERLTENNFDRITMLCRAFRFPGGGPGLPPDEVGSAASEAYLRVVAMGANFRERELGQFRAAVARTVHNTCMDYGRRELRHKRHAAGSLDSTWEPDGEGGPYDAVLAAYDADLRARADEALREEASRREAEGLVRWAIGRVGNDNYRAVLELTYIEKLDAAAIAERLNITPDNVYQRRRRGVKELEKILRAPRS